MESLYCSNYGRIRQSGTGFTASIFHVGNLVRFEREVRKLFGTFSLIPKSSLSDVSFCLLFLNRHIGEKGSPAAAATDQERWSCNNLHRIRLAKFLFASFSF